MSTMHEFDPNYPRPTDAPKFTPGPWESMCEDVDGVRPLGDDGVRFCRVFEKSHSCGARYRGEICSVHAATNIRGITVAERNANAHLIAAAPDLYEACSVLLDQFEQRGCPADQDHPDRVAVEKARAALAKAVQP